MPSRRMLETTSSMPPPHSRPTSAPVARWETIEGRVHDFEVDGQPIAGNPQLMLGTANIGNSNGGFFKGDTSATFAGDTFAGKWGGQFYSNGESDGKPGSVCRDVRCRHRG